MASNDSASFDAVCPSAIPGGICASCIPHENGTSEATKGNRGEDRSGQPDLEASCSFASKNLEIDDGEVEDASEDAIPMTDRRSLVRFLDNLPDGMPLWKSFLVTFVVCVVAGALQFVAIPNSNPLKDPERKGIWHCAVGCSLIWMPISMLYIVFMTNRWVLRETGGGVTVLARDMAWMWAAATVLFVCSVLFWNSIWYYPFPFGGFPSASGGLIALGTTMWVILYRRFRKLGFSGSLKTLMFKGFMVFVVFVWSLIILVGIMLMLGAVQYVPMWACALIFPAMRHGAKTLSEFLLRFIDEDATIVAENLAMTSFGVGLTLLVGNGGDAWLAVAIAVLDITFGLVTSLQMHDNRALRFWLRLRKCCRRPTEARVRRAVEVGKATFIASEVGEVVVPITYLVVFLIVYCGPYADAFTGIGTSDFGVPPPKDIPSFLQTMAVLIIGDAMGTVILKFLVSYLTGLDTFAEMRRFYGNYGLILTIQTIWIIHTAFCATMILCGLDYSWKLQMIQN